VEGVDLCTLVDDQTFGVWAWNESPTTVYGAAMIFDGVGSR
jgi:hypothetical protein